VNTGFVNQQFELVSHFLDSHILPETHWPLLNDLIAERIKQTVGTTSMVGADYPGHCLYTVGGNGIPERI
jgi:hypothetical protein